MDTLEELTRVASVLPEAGRLELLARARELAGEARLQALQQLAQARELLIRADAGQEALPPGLESFDRYAGAFSGRVEREDGYGR